MYFSCVRELKARCFSAKLLKSTNLLIVLFQRLIPGTAFQLVFFSGGALCLTVGEIRSVGAGLGPLGSFSTVNC